MRSLRSSRLVLSPLLLAVLAPIAAQAHPGHSASSGWEQGVMHPLTGLDHLLAILAVGLWAARVGGRSRAWLPLGFLGLMAAGAWVGQTGVTLPGVESILLASVFVLGLCVATVRRMPAGIAAAMVALFAMAHGYAHGSEMSAGAHPVVYAAGFLTATAAVMASGLGLGVWALGSRREAWMRWAGAGIAAGGLLCAVA
ncbi:MAG: HupE/UreJ family protein [Verrucomicrobiales bacterium]|nr:HupE/UreJ family protein [Verrucomicrobiales bacterium]